MTSTQFDSTEFAESTASLSPEDRRIVRGCLYALGALSVGTWVGVASSPYLVNNYPLLLVGISPLSRHVVLIAPIVDPWWLLLICGTRALIFTAFSYFLGRSLGEPGLIWLDHRAERAARFVRWLQRFFQRWSYLAVFIFPLGAMACVAGVARMRPVGFFITASSGIVFRLSLLIWFASSIREPLMILLEFIRTYQVPATAVCVVGLGGYQLLKWRRRRASDSVVLDRATQSAESGQFLEDN